MSDYDLLIRGKEDIGIAEGKFVALGRNLSGTTRKEMDATGLAIFSGVIDAHVHFNEPGRTHWEGFSTGSKAAAAGGSTTIFEMPLNAHPPTLDGPSFDAKLAAAQNSSVVDFGLWGGLVPGNLNQLETLKNRGVVGLKAFMCNSGMDDFLYADFATLEEGMKIAAGLGMLVAVHAESEEITQRLTTEKSAAGKKSILDYLKSRPLEAELDAIRSAIELAHKTGCRIHIVHVSSGSAVRLITEARASGVNVTCETCPHYLLFQDSDLEVIGALAKCSPPFRSAPEQADLRNRLEDVLTIGSDHSPSPPEMKQDANFFKVWGGISGCQHLLPLLVDHLKEFTAEQISRWASKNVAQLFQIPDKGAIAIGNDADLTMLQTGVDEVISPETLRYRHKQSAYSGRHLSCRVVHTVLRGQTIFENGRFTAQTGGQLVRPKYL